MTTAPAAHILAATDFSALARHAVDRASRLAAQSASVLHIVHCLELDTLDALRELLGDKLRSSKEALRADAQQRLNQLTAELPSSACKQAEARIVFGNPVHVLAREAEALGADMVVLGARGESQIRHALLGSTAARLLRKKLALPVLVVKQAPKANYRQIVIAVDFSEVSLQLIWIARQWAPKAGLVLLHVYNYPFEGMLWRAGIDNKQIASIIKNELDKRHMQLFELAARAGLSASDYVPRVIHGDPAHQIMELETDYHADLIVLGKHGTHASQELLLGSITRHVLEHAQADVLVVVDPRYASA